MKTTVARYLGVVLAMSACVVRADERAEPVEAGVSAGPGAPAWFVRWCEGTAFRDLEARFDAVEPRSRKEGVWRVRLDPFFSQRIEFVERKVQGEDPSEGSRRAFSWDSGNGEVRRPRDVARTHVARVRDHGVLGPRRGRQGDRSQARDQRRDGRQAHLVGVQEDSIQQPNATGPPYVVREASGRMMRGRYEFDARSTKHTAFVPYAFVRYTCSDPRGNMVAARDETKCPSPPVRTAWGAEPVSQANVRRARAASPFPALVEDWR